MLVVALGSACNNACVFCAQGELRAREPGPPADPIERLSALAPGEAVALVGGEPTLWDRLPEWIRAAHDRGAAPVLVQTNGRRLAYRGYAAALRAASPRVALDVSLHGSTAPMHDYHTSTPGSFGQTVKGLANARAAGIPFAVTTVVTRSNFRHLAEIVRLAGALGARAVELAIAAPLGSAARAADRVIAAPELVAPHVARAVAEAASMGLGWRAGASASGPDIAGCFAGLGPVEEVAPEGRRRAPPEPAPDGKRRLDLVALGRPAPGRAEVRVPQRRTGAELRPLFPTLFHATDAPHATEAPHATHADPPRAARPGDGEALGAPGGPALAGGA